MAFLSILPTGVVGNEAIAASTSGRACVATPRSVEIVVQFGQRHRGSRENDCCADFFAQIRILQRDRSS